LKKPPGGGGGKGARGMTERLIRIKVPKGRLQEIMDEIDAAQNTIYRCYTDLMALGFVTVEEDTVEDN